MSEIETLVAAKLWLRAVVRALPTALVAAAVAITPRPAAAQVRVFPGALPSVPQRSTRTARAGAESESAPAAVGVKEASGASVGTSAPPPPAESDAQTAAAAPSVSPALAAPPPSVTSSPPAAPPPANLLAAPAELTPPPKKEPHWYDKIKVRGYTQLRYNRFPTFDTNDLLVNDQGDKSIGDNSGFFIRRARVILYGDVHERVSIYLQPDFASSISSQLNVTILRDWYADLHLDAAKEWRIRVGQSKVPFGFENMQSSQNRLPFDRNDAINSALKDERDIGAFFYWAPAEIRKRFKHLVDANLKGSGDYGVVGIGVYNGQTANRPERNDNKHVVARLTWPFLFGEQFLELGLAGYYGRYNVTTTEVDGVAYTLAGGQNDLVDTRALATFVLYPQPFGIYAEYNVGRGPSLGANDPTVVASRDLHGGYVTVAYQVSDLAGTTMFPYARYTYYDGGKKFEDNAPHYLVKELEFGLEWQLAKALEITGAYMVTDRTSSRAPYLRQEGHIARLQVQFNY